MIDKCMALDQSVFPHTAVRTIQNTGGGGGTDITGKQVNAIAQSMKSIQIEQKSTIIDNHKNECDRFLTIFDICRLINIDFIDYYRFLWSIEIIDL